MFRNQRLVALAMVSAHLEAMSGEEMSDRRQDQGCLAVVGFVVMLGLLAVPIAFLVAWLAIGVILAVWPEQASERLRRGSAWSATSVGGRIATFWSRPVVLRVIGVGYALWALPGLVFEIGGS